MLNKNTSHAPYTSIIYEELQYKIYAAEMFLPTTRQSGNNACIYTTTKQLLSLHASRIISKHFSHTPTLRTKTMQGEHKVSLRIGGIGQGIH